jgi:hypothetical protein
MLHLWLVPLLLLLLAVVVFFYMILRFFGGTGIRTDGQAVVDKDHEEESPTRQL